MSSSLVAFTACGHQTTTRPLVGEASEIEFDKTSNTFMRPSMCLDCSITHFKNRQMLLMESCASRFTKDVDALVDVAVKTRDGKDSKEILMTGKRRIVSDIISSSVGEVEALWQDFDRTWNGAEQHNPTTNTTTGVPSSVSIDILSTSISRTESDVSVSLTWRNKENGKELSRQEISEYRKALDVVLRAVGL